MKLKLSQYLTHAGIAALTLMLCFTIASFMSGCTDNDRAKNWGGTMTVDLNPGQKLVEVTWKNDDSLWLLMRPMHPGEAAETWEFKEKSGFGVWQGKVVIKEQNATPEKK